MEGVILHSGEEDVFGVDFLFSSSSGVGASVPLGLDMVDLALSVDSDWLSVIVLDVSIMVVLLGILMMGSWMGVVGIGAMMGMGKVFEPV